MEDNSQSEENKNYNIPVNVFFYLNNKDNDSIVKQSFPMSKNLQSMNNSGYYTNFINMFEQYNLTSLDTESLENDKIKRYTTERERSIFLAAQP